MNMKNLQTLVISLTRSIDRRELATQSLSEKGHPWKFVDAIDGKKLVFPLKSYPQNKVQRLLGYQLSSNEIACYLSHRLTWEACVKSNQITLVFEDDFKLLNSFDDVIENLLGDNSKWELVRLQTLGSSTFKVVQEFPNFQLVDNHHDPVGATAYVLKPSAAAKLLLHSEYIYEPVDHFLEHTEKHGIQMLAAYPYPVTITGADSTIVDRNDERKPIKGLRKRLRSIHRAINRITSSDPWFPK